MSDHDADGKAGVDVAVEAKISHHAGVSAAGVGLQAGDDLHGTDFRRAADRPGREGGTYQIEGCQVGTQLAFHMRDNVHNVRIFFDGEEVGDSHCAVFTDAAEIVAAQVHEHDVLGALLWVGQ